MRLVARRRVQYDARQRGTVARIAAVVQRDAWALQRQAEAVKEAVRAFESRD